MRDLFINGSTGISELGLDFTAFRKAGALPISISVYVYVSVYFSHSPSLSLPLSPHRLADYFCINHHDTGKATQFSAPVGKVRGVPKRWHEA